MTLKRLKKLAGLTESMEGQAENDFGHRDATNSASLTPYPVRDYRYRRGEVPEVRVNNMGNNTMYNAKVDAKPINECDCDEVDALHDMLQRAGISDEQIADGISFTQSGWAKLQAKFGDKATNMLDQLATKLRQGDENLSEDVESDRYSYESDFLGNVTVRDTTTGKDTFVEGSQAAALLKQLKAAEPNEHEVQSILARYAGMMEGGGMSNYRDAFNEDFEEQIYDSFDAVLERPSPSQPDEYEDRPVTVYVEIDRGSRGARGEFGRPMEPDEGPSASVVRVVDQETGQEYELSDSEREYLEDKAVHDVL